MKQLKENIYYIGEINPNMRVFDIIMKTEYGTSYNSYLVKGEKIAVVETIHDRFSDIFLENISEIVPPEKIDYIIMNHTEPDHSGSIARLVEINPDITVVGTAAAIKNISNITNTDFKSHIVKTGDILDLGKGMEMQFIVAPNLHWPDSMFTYLPSSETVFTCDFLGAHYCEPQITDDVISYPNAYADAFAYYYAAIFGPFKKFVIEGLDKLEPLKFDMVCTSHGPVLKDGIKNAIQKYREWSQPKVKEKNVAIFYVSAYGYTKSMAETLEDELNKRGVPAKSYNIIENDICALKEALEGASGIMLGSPTINRDAVAPVWNLLSCTDAVINRGKPAMVFGSYGWTGEACAMLEARISGLGMKIAEDSFKALMKPSESDLETLRQKVGSFIEKL